MIRLHQKMGFEEEIHILGQSQKYSNHANPKTPKKPSQDGVRLLE